MNTTKLYTIRNTKRKSQPTKQIVYQHTSGKLQESVSQLQEGQEFENMTELFDSLDVYLPNSGNKRIAALNRLECFLSVEKLGSKRVRIKEIYQEPIEYLDGRSQGNHSVYSSYLKAALLYSLMQENGYTKEFTYNDFWIEMGIRNVYYANEDVKKELPNYDHEITADIVTDYYKWTGSKSKNITDYILDSLQNENFIRYEKHLMVKTENDFEPKRATSKQVSLIGTVEKAFMKEMGYKTKQEVFLAGQSRALYKKVKEEIKMSYFEQFTVYIYGKEILQYGITENLNEAKENLNKLITQSDKNGAERRMLKETQRLEEEYKEYTKNILAGKPISKSSFKMSNGHHLYSDENYAQSFDKVAQYLSPLDVDPDKKELMDKIISDQNRKRIQESRKKDGKNVSEC